MNLQEANIRVRQDANMVATNLIVIVHFSRSMEHTSAGALHNRFLQNYISIRSVNFSEGKAQLMHNKPWKETLIETKRGHSNKHYTYRCDWIDKTSEMVQKPSDHSVKLQMTV